MYKNRIHTVNTQMGRKQKHAKFKVRLVNKYSLLLRTIFNKIKFWFAAAAIHWNDQNNSTEAPTSKEDQFKSLRYLVKTYQVLFSLTGKRRITDDPTWTSTHTSCVCNFSNRHSANQKSNIFALRPVRMKTQWCLLPKSFVYWQPVRLTFSENATCVKLKRYRTSIRVKKS